ncbi:DUF4097 family beta strand repeat protein [Vagococcus sp. BWB3-3]|uniref:DUF4097 family beta strand repeat protein n=1 Tax=Vagococcus allomyrinae TaxID=2794353 RepID=A0A940P7J8_9ENTE|nr:DUF4097 family beta strand repeat-containing protein [Vagococcus allomyrinae]MBP1039909.1 DUF4097 family beta strand repeat protein [Vagococcus allomyrinae]
MSKIDQFFIEMEALFLKGDLSAFDDLKEDLLEHISIQLEEGLTEEEILTRLGEPADLVDEFYEEQRLHTALTAETDVVALENVKEVYLNERKEKIFSLYEGLQRLLTCFLQVVLILTGLFSLSYLGIELLKERHIAMIPLLMLITSISGLCLIVRSNKDRYRTGSSSKRLFLGMLFVGLVIGTVVSILNGAFFYKGTSVSQTAELTKEDLRLVTVKSDFPIDLLTMPTTQSTIRVEVKGNVKQAAKERLNKLSQQNKETLTLDFGESGLFDSFTQLKPVEVVLYLPSQLMETEIQLDLNKGVVQAQDLSVKKIVANVKKGEFKGDNLQSTDFSFNSESGELIMNHYQTAIQAASTHGKIILKKGSGNVTVETASGLVSLIGITAEKTRLKSQDGKVIVNETVISELAVESQSNAVVLEKQHGNTKVSMGGGKLIVTNNQGRLEVVNQSASVIVAQDSVLAGNISSQSGLVKWVQAPQAPMNFALSSEQGKVVNELTTKSNGPVFDISSSTGNINVYDKVIKE